MSCDVLCVLGDMAAIKNFEEMLSRRYVYKQLAIFCGFEWSDDGQAVFLSRVLSVAMDTHPRRIVYEPDARHARILISDLGLEKRKRSRDSREASFGQTSRSLTQRQRCLKRACSGNASSVFGGR